MCWRVICMNPSCPAKGLSWTPWLFLMPLSKGSARAGPGLPSQAADITRCGGPWSARTIHRERREARCVSVPKPGTWSRAWRPFWSCNRHCTQPWESSWGSAAAVQKTFDIENSWCWKKGEKSPWGKKIKYLLSCPKPTCTCWCSES